MAEEIKKAKIIKASKKDLEAVNSKDSKDNVKESKDSNSKDNSVKKEKLGVRIKRFFKDYKSELKKIVWPSRSELFNNTGIVIAVIAVVSVIVGLLDLAFGMGITQLAHIKSLFVK